MSPSGCLPTGATTSFARPSHHPAMVLAVQEDDTGLWEWEIKPQLNDEVRPSTTLAASSTWAWRLARFYRNGPLLLSFQGRLVPTHRYESQAEFLREYYGADRLPASYALHSLRATFGCLTGASRKQRC